MLWVLQICQVNQFGINEEKISLETCSFPKYMTLYGANYHFHPLISIEMNSLGINDAMLSGYH